ncbi:cobyrinate a,c-diamide synthase [Heliorestis convoluta]|uniref:Cobyrinate a,c-diamide synthase n=1 Tax=Heliorestis convoluta TaxID=356322 RepID=A0A5Q2MY86_9FIRM|nr:cobyrinate a,c-diamide synthase [Heliorestis convoluta]QGG46891.1 cobyrinic acid a,c-diamide synthase [Heliorestis convoluta]
MIATALIAGTHSGVGKTTLTMGLLTAFRNRGKKVQSFKCGPDYIDPTFYRWITGRPCSNLDSWLMDPSTIQRLYHRAIAGADLAFVEGVMGLYDGAVGEKPGEAGSSASIARILNIPIILVVDGTSAAQSVAATVHGFATLRQDLNVAAVIINRVGSERHGQMIQKAIEETCQIPVYGWLLKKSIEPMPERHLGLVSAVTDQPALRDYCNRLAEVIEQQIDLDRLYNQIRSHFFLLEEKRWDQKNNPITRIVTTTSNQIRSQKRIPIAIARDEAFHFYYEDSLRDLSDRGIEWVPFQPVAGETFPAHVKGIYLGGGYPELYLEALQSNERFIQDLRQAFQEGLPIYGECGGYMFLSQSIEDLSQRRYKLAGLIPANSVMQKRRQALGYVTATALTENVLTSPGENLRGHEFHYSSLTYQKAELQNPVFAIAKTTLAGEKAISRSVGYVEKRLTASYVHFHLSAYPAAMDRFVSYFSS